MSSIVIDGLSEEDFRRSIQNRLREGKASSTIMRLRGLLAPYAGPGGILPERFLKVEVTDLILSGWDTLGEAAARHDRPGRPVNAVSIAFGWPGEDLPQPDAQGHLPPCLETSYFNDDAFPFSQSTRETLLEGYSYDGCTWSGDPEATDTALTLAGVDDLNGALAALEAKLLADDEPDEEHLRAGSLGACLLSALLTQAVTDQIGRDGLPRPLCVTTGSSGVYPYFDTPVAGMPPEAIKVAEKQEDTVPSGQDVPVPRYSSLLLTGIPRAKKRAVLVLEETEDEIAVRIAGLRNLHHPEREDSELPGESEPVAAAPAEPDPAPPVADLPTDGGLLLAKKPVKHSADFRDMLGPRDPALQQRLDNLLAGHLTPLAEVAAVMVPVAEALPTSDWSDEPSWEEESYLSVTPEAASAAVPDDEPTDWPSESRWAKVKRWLGWFRL